MAEQKQENIEFEDVEPILEMASDGTQKFEVYAASNDDGVCAEIYISDPEYNYETSILLTAEEAQELGMSLIATAQETE